MRRINRASFMLPKVNNSIVFRIGMLMTAITLMALFSMFSSFIISEMAASDAGAINLSGSLRKKSYELLAHGSLGQDSAEEFETRLTDFETTLSNPAVLNNVRSLEADDQVAILYRKINDDWHYDIKPWLRAVQRKEINQLDLSFIDGFVENIDKLVNQYQQDAENKIELLRLIQIISLFVTLIFVYVAMNNVSRYIEKPLNNLTRMARKVRDGQLHNRVEVESQDELGLLANSFNAMSEALSEMYEKLEDKVEEKTLQLKQSNNILQFLFETARRMNEGMGSETDFQPILDKISTLSGIENMDLCLSTEASSTPYIHLLTIDDDAVRPNCDGAHCDGCVGEGSFIDGNFIGGTKASYSVKFPLIQEGKNYGVLVARVGFSKGLEQWQHDLIQSVADQIAMALSLDSRGKQDRRMALLNERTIIARELHDSLAQSLSYLKIQVMRLQKSHDKGMGEETFKELIGELREGLGSAYRQLRELLSTFRLQIDGAGLKGALIKAFGQLNQRSDMKIELNYQIDSVLLNPNEEIHMLQISKEAVQNAIYHSKGTRVLVSLILIDGKINLTVSDDGIGISDDPSKLNHYGLAIMSERSRNLNGEVSIARQPQGGTLVKLVFHPSSQHQTIKKIDANHV